MMVCGGRLELERGKSGRKALRPYSRRKVVRLREAERSETVPYEDRKAMKISRMWKSPVNMQAFLFQFGDEGEKVGVERS